MPRRILIINGHPDPRHERACAALANAYARGALEARHEIRRLDVGAIDFPLIRTAEDFIDGAPPPQIKAAQASIAWAEHLVLVFPLWLGSPPALLKGFLEQTFRYGFALSNTAAGTPKGLLGKRSARLVVTMGMPAPAFRWLFGAFGVRAVERSLLWLCGVHPVRHTLIGMVGAERFSLQPWLARIQRLGRLGV